MTQKISILAFFLYVSILSFSSCREDRISPAEKNGIVFWRGPVEVDGCDWLIQVDNEWYHPDNLPDAYKINSLEVKIKYSVKPKANNFHCSMNPSAFYQTIDIKSISKK